VSKMGRGVRQKSQAREGHREGSGSVHCPAFKGVVRRQRKIRAEGKEQERRATLIRRRRDEWTKVA